MVSSVISLFSGCGGMDLGFLGDFDYGGRHYGRLPFEVTWANDVDQAACSTYAVNLHHEINCGDIRHVMTAMPTRADVVIGGFPCQDFSQAGKRRGFEFERGVLYRQMALAIKRTKPKAFVAENVVGLLSIPGALERILQDFRDLGYNVGHHVLKAQDYGVPQTRERLFFVGVPHGTEFEFPGPSGCDPVTASEAIGDLAEMPEGAVDSHFWSNAKKSKGQGNAPIKADRPSPTIRAEHHGNIEFHYSLPRRLSAREAARLQSFPDEFRFPVSTTKAYKQIGNAVPPVLAWHLAGAVSEALR
jgi:DNA (cytosine-5)-methyltransferase 1